MFGADRASTMTSFLSHTVSLAALLAAGSLLGCTGEVSSDGTPPGAPTSSGASSTGNRSGSNTGGAGSNAGGRTGTGSSSSSSGAPTSGGGAISPPGGTGGDTGAPVGPAPTTFSCDAQAASAETPLRRLTMVQYRNTVRDLVASFTGNDTGALSAVSSALDSLPDDRREPVPQDLHGSYRRLDQTIQQAHVDSMYAAGVAVGKALTQDSLISRVIGACASDGQADNDSGCRDDFIRDFGARALRRPLDAQELEFYRSVYGATTAADPAAYADVITVLLNAPQFVYFVEHGEAAASAQAGTYELSPYELASRLSYQFWQTSPDDALLTAAANGSLLDPTVYEAEVSRLMSDPRTRATLDEFFADWMKVEELALLDKNANDPLFLAFAGNALPKPSLRQAMIDDVVDMLGYYSFEEPSSLARILLSDRSFARDADLARIYGVPAWDGSGAPPALPAGERAGLLTRALFLSTGSANTRPIMKGVFIRRHVLCDEIPPPPPGVNATPPELRSDMTTREVVEELTEMTGSTCAGCHMALINPLGFATESFDALGRYRSQQILFDDDGTRIGEKAVDTRAVPRVIGDDATVVNGPLELMNKIVESGKGEACVARNFFRFTFARWENLSSDGCTLESLRAPLSRGGAIPELLRAAALAAAFKHRAF
jgi:hypothetical protein